MTPYKLYPSWAYAVGIGTIYIVDDFGNLVLMEITSMWWHFWVNEDFKDDL